MRSEILDREILDALILYIKKLNDESENGALVIVEGKRDFKALRSLGFVGKIMMLCHNGNFTKLVEEAEKYQKVILLFDLDREGSSLTKKAAMLLEGKKNIFDLFFRRKLSSTTHGKVKHIEELSRFTEHMDNKL